MSRTRKPTQIPMEASGHELLDQPKTLPLALWNPQPIKPPEVDRAVLNLPDVQRSVEVILYSLGRLEYWLSPTGWIRAWIRLNLWIAVVLIVCAFTVLPAITAVVAGLTGLTMEVSWISDDLSRSFTSLLPVLGILILVGVGFYLTRRHPDQFPWCKFMNRETRKEETK